MNQTPPHDAGDDLHHITRIEAKPDEAHPNRSPTHGWLVRVRRQGVQASKFFSDKKFGGREAALNEHAIPYRDNLLETLPEPDDPVKRSAEARSHSGVIGLHFLHKDIGNGTRKPYIQLSWIDAGGQRQSTSYSVEKWGLRRAVWNGCLRLFNERPDRRDPYEMFRIAYPNIIKRYGLEEPLPEEGDPETQKETEASAGPASPPTRDPITRPLSRDTEATLARHLDAIKKRDVEALLANFTEDSAIVTADGVIRGRAAIGADAEAFFSETPEGLIEAIKVVRWEVVGEIAFIIWKAEPYGVIASETFFIRDGKILVQTYVSQER